MSVLLDAITMAAMFASVIGSRDRSRLAGAAVTFAVACRAGACAGAFAGAAAPCDAGVARRHAERSPRESDDDARQHVRWIVHAKVKTRRTDQDDDDDCERHGDDTAHVPALQSREQVCNRSVYGRSAHRMTGRKRPTE